jgi:hypothetical protein
VRPRKLLGGTIRRETRELMRQVQSGALARSGSLRAGAGQGLPPFPAPLCPLAAPLPSLRSGQVSLDEAEHFLHNRDASVAYAPMVFGFIPECRSESYRI